jgi:hypothetical protein
MRLTKFLEEQIKLVHLFLIFRGLDGDWGGTLHTFSSACRTKSLGEPNANPDRAMIKVLNKDGVAARADFRAGYADGGSGVEDMIDT